MTITRRGLFGMLAALFAGWSQIGAELGPTLGKNLLDTPRLSGR